MRPRSLHRAGMLAALVAGMAAAGYQVAAPASLRAPTPPRRGPSTADLSRVAAAQAKRERRAARNRGRS